MFSSQSVEENELRERSIDYASLVSYCPGLYTRASFRCTIGLQISPSRRLRAVSSLCPCITLTNPASHVLLRSLTSLVSRRFRLHGARNSFIRACRHLKQWPGQPMAMESQTALVFRSTLDVVDERYVCMACASLREWSSRKKSLSLQLKFQILLLQAGEGLALGS